MIVLYASISVLNWMRAATGSQCKETKRGVTWALLGSLKTSRADFCTKNERNVRHVFCSHGRYLESHVTWTQKNRQKKCNSHTIQEPLL